MAGTPIREVKCSRSARGDPGAGEAPLDLVMAAGLALLYYASLDWTEDHAALRFIQLVVAGHLLVAIAPWLTGERLDGFWQFNRILFLRYLTGDFYVAVLWAGLSVALAAVDKLFGVDIDSEMYAHLWAFLAFVFHPWFFLAGVPRDYAELESRDDYPDGLKVFTQFVLMPLVVIYLAILTAYLGKVIITRTWPTGWIGYLVSSVSCSRGGSPSGRRLLAAGRAGALPCGGESQRTGSAGALPTTPLVDKSPAPSHLLLSN